MDVVLLSEDGTPIGRAPKATVHGAQTPLHLAFSCHIVGPDGRVLLTRRALTKVAWPGVWTNAFCGHPMPDESIADAVRRHARSELGVTIEEPRVALPDFRYRATDASGVVENEICPVYLTRIDGDPRPNPDEVCEFVWAEPAELADAIRATPWAFSPWLVLQVPRLPLYAEVSA